MRFSGCTLLLSALVAVGCSSKVTQTLDTNKQMILECLPPHLDVLDELIRFADLWRVTGTDNPPDPAGLVWSEQGNGTINYTITVTGFSISGVISFYDPNGNLQNLTLSTTSLSQAIDDAATELRNLFGAADKFMVGTWTIADTGGSEVESGSGAFTAIIGGSTNQNELEELRTTTGTPAGGPPPNAVGTITVVDGADTCTLTFDTPHAPAAVGLLTDETPTQEYPIGTIHFVLTENGVTQEADLVFDGTVIAKLTVTGISGRFDINLETLNVNFVP